MDDCSVHAFCSNTIGSYSCNCLKGMDGRVRILTSAKPNCTTAVSMQSAQMLLARIAVIVFLAIKAMDGLATTLMNARMVLSSVTHTQHVQTPTALMGAAAYLGFMEMVKFVEMSTNIWLGHMTAARTRLV